MREFSIASMETYSMPAGRPTRHPFRTLFKASVTISLGCNTSTCQLTFLVNQYDAAHTPILKRGKCRDPDAYKTAARLIAQSEFDEVARGWALGTGCSSAEAWPANFQLSLDLKLIMPPQAFGCDEDDWSQWVSLLPSRSCSWLCLPCCLVCSG